jgi:hypothetical protein
LRCGGGEEQPSSGYAFEFVFADIRELEAGAGDDTSAVVRSG